MHIQLYMQILSQAPISSLDITSFHESGIKQVQNALSTNINGFTFSMDFGQTAFQQQMSAHSLDLLMHEPVCIIGTSFAVPYFNDRKRFRAIAQFLTKFSKKLFWMVPDEPFISTCQARGMDEKEIEKQVNHYCGNLKAKIKYAEYGIKDLDVESRTILWDTARQIPQYTELLLLLTKLYESNEDFKNDVNSIVAKTLMRNFDLGKQPSQSDYDQIKIGKDFLLKELSCILAIGSLSNRPALYVYQTAWEVPVLEYLVAGRYGLPRDDSVAMLVIKAY